MLRDGPLPVVGILGATAHHAQLVEATGFRNFVVSGAFTSGQLLGLPDAGLLTLTELVENVRNICQAVSIPVTVDCDTGFGNAINVCRTVGSVIQAGAAAFFIEDQVAPKRCGFVKGKEIVSLEEAVGKYRAALETRDSLDPDVVVIARTDARGAAGGGMDEVFRRGRAYLDAGVDMFYVEALQTREEIRAVRAAFPDVLLMITPFAINPPLTTEEMQEMRLCWTGFQVAKIGGIAMYDFLLKFREAGVDVYNDFMASHAEHPLANFGAFDLTGFPHLTELEERYLPAEQIARYDQSIGVYDPRGRTTIGSSAKKTASA